MTTDYRSQDDFLQTLEREQLEKAVALAAAELQRRLEREALCLPPRTRSRDYKSPWDRAAPVIHREAHPCEMMIARAIALTWDAAQFGCSPDGSVFTADTDGYSWPDSDHRDPATRLSPLLDEVAAIFNSPRRRDGLGGRFYERDGRFFDADDGEIFVEIHVGDDVPFRQASRPFRRTSPPDKSAAGGRSLWDKLLPWRG